MSRVQDYNSEKEKTARSFSFLERMNAPAFMEATRSLDELSREPRYIIDVRHCNQDVLRVATAPQQGADWFDLPVAAVESLTPIGVLDDDPARVVASILFRPEFRSLAATFRQLRNPTGWVAAGGDSTSPREESLRQTFDAAYERTEADEDPGNAAADGLIAEDGSDAALGRTLANYGAVEPDTTEPPVMAAMEVPGTSLLLETARDVRERTLPVEIAAAQAFLNACVSSSPRVTYGPRPGAKVPFHGARPGRDFTHVDCSGFVREMIWRATTPHFNFSDGSVVQHDWIRAQGFTRSTIDAALLRDGAIRIAFLRPQDSPSRVGHVVLVHNARTLESHGGVGPNSRAWNKQGWQARAFVYLLTPSAS